MGEEKRKKKAKRKAGKLVRLLMLVLIVVLGWQVWELGIPKMIGEIATEKKAENKPVSDRTEVEQEMKTEERKVLEVPFLNQDNMGYPTGCEMVTALMALQNIGVHLTPEEFLGYLPQSQLYDKNGKTWGPDPKEFFVGNPSTESGFGCFAPVLKGAIQSILLDKIGHSAYVEDLTGRSLDELRNEINQGNPVILWASSGMKALTYKDSWYIEGKTVPYFWPKGEHCLLLIGYDGEYLLFHDPNKGDAVAYAQGDVAIPYQELGQQALVIRKTE